MALLIFISFLDDGTKRRRGQNLWCPFSFLFSTLFTVACRNIYGILVNLLFAHWFITRDRPTEQIFSFYWFCLPSAVAWEDDQQAFLSLSLSSSSLHLSLSWAFGSRASPLSSSSLLSLPLLYFFLILFHLFSRLRAAICLHWRGIWLSSSFGFNYRQNYQSHHLHFFTDSIFYFSTSKKITRNFFAASLSDKGSQE